MSHANLDDDPVQLAQALIQCPSVTPDDAGALDTLSLALVALGFHVHRHKFHDEGTASVDNLFAKFGKGGPHFCFAGHTDVVPPGDLSGWSVDPFEGLIANNMLYGRGAADMKSAIAAFVSAAARVAPRLERLGKGSISLLITGDEEGPAVNGTVKMLEHITAHGEKIDHCLVGEPTSQHKVGDTLKIGRRGSVTGKIGVFGVQGHVAYPQRAENPIPRLVAILDQLAARKLDAGTPHFEPSNLEITTVDVGNPATNVIPAAARATFNIRHNDLHKAGDLEAWVRRVCDQVVQEHGGRYELQWSVGGDCFLTQPGSFTTLVSDAVSDVTGARPALSTGGGTSDARFIKNYCPVAELGLPGESMHKADERASLADIRALANIYQRTLERYFGI